METAYRQILSKIIKVHDQYRNRVDEMSESKRNRKGNKSDNSEEKFFIDQLTKLEVEVRALLTNMQKSPALKSKKQQINLVKGCSQDILSIVRRKQLMFKVNNNLKTLVQETHQLVRILTADLKTAGQTAFLCCGTDGAKKFKQSLDQFNIRAQQWRILTSLEAKDSVQSLISPDYEENNFKFIKQILQKNWPGQPKQVVKIQYVDREVVKTVNTAEPSRLALANQYLYGINHETNTSYALKIYHQQAKRGDPKAASFLGQAYEQGILLPRDMQKAVSYYETSMKSKDPYGSYRMAILLINGHLSQKQNREDIKKAHEILIKLSDSSNPSAQAATQLGELYEQGKFRCDKEGLYTVPIDLKKSMVYYKKGRDLNVPRATNNLGVLYINNKFFSQSNPSSSLQQNEDVAIQNIRKGKKYLEEAMFQGFSQAFYNLGCMFESGIAGRRDQEQALLYFYNGGLKGDHHSRLKYAYQLMKQTSIMKQQYEQHYRIAHRWLQSIIHHIEIAQSQGIMGNSRLSRSSLPPSHPLSHPSLKQLNLNIATIEQKAEAMFYLGLMYQFGFGVDKSHKKAFNYFLKSADLDHAAAKNKLGDCYFSGFGTQEDRQIAIGCYHEAAQAGNTDALVNLGTIYLNGIPDLVNIDYQKANEFFIKAVELQNSDAMVHLSYMYRAGLGFEKDMDMAKNLLEQAAKNRNSHALYMLKQMGTGFDDRILFNNLDNQFLSGPKKFNVRQLIPICSKVPSI